MERKSRLINTDTTGSAMPLVWAHSEFVKLAFAITAGQPIEFLNSVEARYQGHRPDPKLRLWRTDTPVVILPRGASLRVEDIRPFMLHVSFDDWVTSQDLATLPLAFDMHGVVLHLQNAGKVVFTRRYADGWEGVNHEVAIA